MQWKIWYKDGLIAEGSTIQDWNNFPEDGVICISIRFGFDKNDNIMSEVISGSDWYWMHNDKIYQSGTSSEIPNVWLSHNAPEGASLKKGRWTTEQEMNRIHKEMMEWATFKKTIIVDENAKINTTFKTIKTKKLNEF